MTKPASSPRKHTKRNFISLPRLLFGLMTLMVFGAAVHICIILLMPYFSQGDAWGRLENVSRINELAILPGVEATNRPIAFMAPDVRYAACRYDLANGPLQLRSPLPNDLWSIALYSRHGENYYLISGRDVQSRFVNLLVVMDESINNKQEERDNAGAGTDALREITVSAPSKTGIILIRAPIPNPAHNAQVVQLLSKAFCRPVTFAAQQQAASQQNAPQRKR